VPKISFIIEKSNRTGGKISFRDVHLYEKHLDNIFIDIALKGKQYTIQN